MLRLSWKDGERTLVMQHGHSQPKISNILLLVHPVPNVAKRSMTLYGGTPYSGQLFPQTESQVTTHGFKFLMCCFTKQHIKTVASSISESNYYQPSM